MQQLRIILPDAKCNLGCKYCLDGYCSDKRNLIDSQNLRNLHGKNKDFSSINVGALIQSIKHYTFKHIGIWGGEPLFNRHLEPLLRAIRSQYPDMPIGILSNGTLLNKDWVKLLNDLDVGLTISHDGAAQSLCRSADYLTPAYINLLHDLKYFKGTNSVIHRFNCDPWEIYQFFKGKGLPKGAQIWFEPFKLMDYRLMDYLPSTSEYQTFYRGWCAVFREGKGGEPKLKSEVSKVLNKLKSHGRTSCGANGRLAVDLSGKIYHCQVAAETKYTGKIDNTLPHWCEKCRHANYCRGICPLISDIYRQKMCMLYHLYFDAAEEVLLN